MKPRLSMKQGSLIAQAPRLAAWTLLLIPLWLAIWSAHVIWLTYSPIPFNDQWVNVQALRDAPKAGWLAYLFSQHNEHRILFPRLVFLADWTWFQGRNGLNMVAIGVIQLIGAAFFVHAAASRRPKALGVLGLAASVAMIASLMQWENWFWGFQVSFVAVYAAAAWAIYLFAIASDDPERIRWGAMAGSLAFLVVATFSMANGVFAGAAMVLVGLVTQRRPKAVLAAAIATAALLAIYLYGYHRTEFHSPPGLALQHPGRFVFYVTVFLGNLWEPASAGRASLVGLGGLAASFAMLFVLARKDGRDPARAALFGVVLFVGMSAAVTSLGRLNFGVEQALSSRYMTPTAYFWAAQALFWALTLERGGAPRIALERTPEAWVLTVARRPGRLGEARTGGDPLPLPLAIVRVPAGCGRSGAGQHPRAHAGRLQRLDRGHRRRPELPRGVSGRAHGLGHGAVPARDPHLGVRRSGPRQGRRAVRPADRAWRGVPRVLRFPDARDRRRGLARQGLGVGTAEGAQLLARRAGRRRRPGAGDRGGGMPRPTCPRPAPEVRDGQSGWLAILRRGEGPEVIAYGITSTGAACELGRKAWGS